MHSCGGKKGCNGKDAAEKILAAQMAAMEKMKVQHQLLLPLQLLQQQRQQLQQLKNKLPFIFVLITKGHFRPHLFYIWACRIITIVWCQINHNRLTPPSSVIILQSHF